MKYKVPWALLRARSSQNLRYVLVAATGGCLLVVVDVLVPLVAGSALAAAGRAVVRAVAGCRASGVAPN